MSVLSLVTLTSSEIICQYNYWYSYLIVTDIVVSRHRYDRGVKG